MLWEKGWGRKRKMNESERMPGAGKVIEKAYNTYFRDVYTYVLRRLGNKTVAEDIAHDVFLTALNRIEVFQNHPQQKGWLIVTARNKMKELRKKMENNPAESLEEVQDVGAEEADYEKIEIELMMNQVIAEEEWELIKDFYLRGITIRELAEKYGITENAMNVRLHRLRKKIRERTGS
ncbi:MAG TPA: hypothetical protein DCZ91_04020 [Lachnospiraceae bacterium]|nr:hypothetical protein [Lachnospiraceae bacterium]